MAFENEMGPVQSTAGQMTVGVAGSPAPGAGTQGAGQGPCGRRKGTADEQASA